MLLTTLLIVQYLHAIHMSTYMNENVTHIVFTTNIVSFVTIILRIDTIHN